MGVCGSNAPTGPVPKRDPADPSSAAPVSAIPSSCDGELTLGPWAGELGVEDSVTIWARGEAPGGEFTFELREAPSQEKKASEDGDLVSVAREERVLQRVTVEAKKDDDYTMKARFSLKGLEPGKKYEVTVAGRSCTFTNFATEEKGSINVLFSSCLGGQGYGRDPEKGWGIFDKMDEKKPDIFLMLGDQIYADDKIPETAKLLTGGEKKNVPAEKMCKELPEFRSRYKYTYGDPVYRQFLSKTSTFSIWDDHEFIDDWGGEMLKEDHPEILRNGVKSFFEYTCAEGPPDAQSPLERKLYRSFKSGPAEFFLLDSRSYRTRHKKYLKNVDRNASMTEILEMEKKSPGSGLLKLDELDEKKRLTEMEGLQEESQIKPEMAPGRRMSIPRMNKMLGETQEIWLLDGLRKCEKKWAIVCCTVPLSWPTGWPDPKLTGYDSWVGDREAFRLFCHMKVARPKNILFITGDVHFPYMVQYDPFNEGKPWLYEMGCTPLSALPLPASKPDGCLNPTVLYAEGQFGTGPMNYGQCQISEDGTVTVTLHSGKGEVLFTKTIELESDETLLSEDKIVELLVEPPKKGGETDKEAEEELAGLDKPAAVVETNMEAMD